VPIRVIRVASFSISAFDFAISLAREVFPLLHWAVFCFQNFRIWFMTSDLWPPTADFRRLV
jgi:hypothetical protein